MTLHLEYVKKHWHVFLGGLVGLILLYVLFKSAARTTAPASDLSQGSYQLQGLNAAGAMQAAQINAGIQTSSLQAEVQSHGIDAQLQSNLAQTAAQLAATQQKTAGEIAVSLDKDQTAIQLQHIVSDATLANTQIQADTLKTLAITAGQTQVQVQQAKNAVGLASIKAVHDDLNYAITHDTGHLRSFFESYAPIALAITGQGNDAVGVAQANTAKAVGTSTGTQIGQIAGGVGSVLTGLFG